MPSPERSPVPANHHYYYDYPSVIEAGDSAEKGKGLLEFWELLTRNKWVVAAITLTAGLIGCIVTLPQPFTYQARELIEIQEPNRSFLNLRTLDPSTSALSAEAYVQNQIRILQSRTLRTEAANAVKKIAASNASFRPDRLTTLMQTVGIPVTAKPPSRESAVAEASSTLNIRSLNGTNMVEITCESADPAVAAAFTNSLVSAYINQSFDARWSSHQQTRAFLTRQLEELRGQLQASETQLQDYARNSNLLVTSGTNNVAEEKLRQLQQELSTASAVRMSQESKRTIAASSAPESLPDVLNDSTLRTYQTKRTELRAQWLEMSALYKPDHYKLQQLNDQINEIDTLLRSERKNILSRIGNEYETSLMREQMLKAAYERQAKVVSQQNEKLTYYNLLKREVETNRQVYEQMLQQVKEAGVAAAMRATHVRLVEPATVPNSPSRPKTAQTLLIALSTGLFLGIVFVALRDQMDHRMHDPGEDLKRLQVPTLGVVLSAGPSGRAKMPNSTIFQLDDKSDLPKLLNEPTPIELATWSAAPSPLVESFRGVLTSLLSPDTKSKVVVFTSPNPREGKTTVISNLAVALAEIDKRVLLIDADMRQPRLHAVFGISNAFGLSDLITQHSALETLPIATLSKETSIYGLRLLPSGPGATSIPRILYSERMNRLFDRLRQEYDMILIDTPPMMSVPDARVLARKADGVVLVLRAGHTTKNVARAAVERLIEDGTPILGSVLNDWNPRSSKSRNYQNGFYYYDDPDARTN